MRNRAALTTATRGVAAIEFALLLVLMLTLLLGLFWSWHVLQTYQTVVRATGDGARYLQEAVFSSDADMNPAQTSGRLLIEQRVTKIVHQGLEAAGLQITPAVQVAVGWSSAAATLEVAYPNNLFAEMGANTTEILPSSLSMGALRATSVVALP